MSAVFDQEQYFQQYPVPVSIDSTTKILEQMKKCICKININQKKGTGFFCNIPSKDIKVFITNNNILDEKIIKINKNLIVTLYDDTQIEIALIKKNMYTNEEYDTTIIEIKEEEEKKIKGYIDYINLDESIFDKDIEKNKSLYILQYPNIYYKDNECKE